MAGFWTEQIATLCRAESPEFIYGDCEFTRVEYEIEFDKTHKSYTQLWNGEILVQYTLKYVIVKCIILYVREDEIAAVLDEKGYWQGRPSVTQMIPNSRFGYYQISGTYLRPISTKGPDGR